MKQVNLLIVLFAFLSIGSTAQNDTLRVLFLGNSYTAYNNLPQLVSNLANADNKELIYDSYTPGGTLLWNFANNENTSQQLDTTAMHKIKSENWDFVILQEQSQVPTIDHYRYNYMYPSVESLEDSISHYNPCAKIMMFMTWGRQNGGQQCSPDNYCSPVFVDFSHMQDSLESAYIGAAEAINASVAPVGIAWKNIIENTNLVLHSSDQSHPNYRGSYLAACVFHAALWNSSPVGNTFTGNLSNSEANSLQTMADSTVFDAYSKWNLDAYEVTADFNFNVFHDSVAFTNLSLSRSPVNYYWDFGDGNTDTAKTPTHTYNSNGSYTVRLIADYCSSRDTTEKTINISTTKRVEYHFNENFEVFPNPATSKIVIQNNGTNKGTLEIELMNTLGQIVISQRVNAARNTNIQLYDLPTGFYIISLRDEFSGSKASFKILKK
ncbi:DUF4886 domain-containing protein [Salibacter halophilus]|uniref:DUF4886 domain-containing protein n=1 Tax=Salibacter halophilus TaxID=1803916 RepID=A0A6N6MB74_9FLAO|nr:DUF4886 domain-containing protein [Salibacter halophilus]KAB1065687.1 DUF4886 domain-containing protein [Salibacter halophilus]